MHSIDDLLNLMARLRDPDNGCPWDRQQDFSTIAPYTIEEAYEVADAIERGDMDELKKELGDLLFQVVFHAQMAGEKQAFGFHDVVDAITEKMISRHPHVFGDEQVESIAHQRHRWEAIKKQEQAHQESVLDGVSKSQPALNRAKKLQLKAAAVGFDWPERDGVLAKLHEELDETKQAIASGNQAAVTEEIGDLLFSCVNLARFVHVDPEAALRHANVKFEQRFRAMEKAAKSKGLSLDDMSLDDMEALWQAYKKKEKQNNSLS